jgi:L-alanine-DL-glutamate epimerase-like enolase superfamily enzyme
MKITAVDSFQLALPYRTSGGFHYIAGRPSSTLAMVLVRISTDDGLTGWGEAFGHAGAAATKSMLDTLVAPLLIGESAHDIDALMTSVRRKIHIFGLSGPAIYAVSGLDIALWDLRGKREGKSIAELLGRRRSEVPVYASFLRCSSDDALRQTCASAVAEGYRTVKLHEITLDRIAAARQALGPDAALAVDTNCPWNLREATAMVEAMRELKLLWLEEPIWPPDDYASLAALRNAGTPISAGENVSSRGEFDRLLTARALDILQPSVCKIGGISEMLKVLELSDRHQVETIPHCGYLGPGYAATLQIVSTLERVPLERLYIELEETPFPSIPSVIDGESSVPSGAGLGCEVDTDIAEKYRVA